MPEPAITVPDSSAVEPQVPKKQAGPVFRLARGPVRWADERIGVANLLRPYFRKVFPDHWSFLLGEIALYSFIVLLLSGVFLCIWFKPSMAEVEYEGSYQLLRGLHMSEAYASTLALSFDIRGGLLLRQMHHWAAMLFVAAMLVHSLRIFFTGAFRKPREINWLIGVGLLVLGIFEGFFGYSLPDDLLSGTGMRFLDGALRATPIIGTWVEFFVFAGQFPGDLIIPRLYFIHILVVPALILGVVALMGALMQINPVWVFGPYNPAQITAGSQPDWYMGFAEGAIRIMPGPGWEWHIGSTTWSWNVFLPLALPMALLFGGMAIYPFIEAWVTGDKSEHHLLDRPRNNPTRTGLGVAAMTWFGMLWLGGGNDVIASQFDVSLNAVTYFLRVAVFVAPVLAFLLAKRICIGLQRADHDRLLHGAESGVIERDPSGRYSERHRPITVGEQFALTQHAEQDALVPVAGDGDGEYSDRQLRVEQLRRRATRFYFADTLRKPTRAELEEAAAHHHHRASHELGAGQGNGHGDGDGHAEIVGTESEHLAP